MGSYTITAKEEDSHERLGAVFGKHGNDHVDDEIKFGSISRGDIDEDVLCVEGDFGVIRVDLQERRSASGTKASLAGWEVDSR